MDYLYKNINGREIYLTFLEPIKNIYEKAPVYFLIPGGGWHYATRQSMIECSDISVKQLRKKDLLLFLLIIVHIMMTKF